MADVLGTLEPLFKLWTMVIAGAVEFAAAMVILGAAVQGIIALLRHVFSRTPAPTASERIRIRLGQWLSLALEFELAADILRTAVAPSWDEIGKLAAIVVIRTVLNTFLQRDIAEARRREQEGG